MCGLLQAWGHLTPPQAEHVRQQVRQATSSGAWPVLPDPDATAAGRTLPPAQLVSPDERTRADASQEAGTAAAAIAPGQTVGSYELLKEISRGGMGVVYRARHTRLEQEVAMKVLLQNDPGAAALERFDREAKTLAQLKHPNIVGVSDYGDHGGLPYLVMELIDGRELKAHLDERRERSGKAPPRRWLIRVLSALAEALAACHALGVVHRDLKPHNVLIEDGTKRPVLVDFGLARPEARTRRLAESLEGTDLDCIESADEESDLTVAGSLLGTPAYMAPEQVAPEDYGEVGEHTDVWGFGAVLFYCLTGEAPYRGSTALNIYKRLLTQEPRDVLELSPDAPRDLVELCRRCLTREPDDRATLDEVRGTLEELDAGESPAPAKTSGPPLVALSLGGLAVAIVVAGLAVYSKGSDPAPPDPVAPSDPAPAPVAAAPTLVLEAVPEWTQAEEVLVTGKTLPGAKVTVERERSGAWELVELESAEADGTYLRKLELAPGTNRYRFRPAGGEEVLVEVGRDVKAPRLEVEGVVGGVLSVPVGEPLQGRVQDESPCVLEVNGQQVPLDNGAFRTVPAGDARVVELVVRDAVDREATVRLLLYRELGPLLDRRRWEAASAKAQDRAIAEVAGRLGDAYELAGAPQVYECGGLRHRIAAFRHRRSGAVLHLLPGGTYRMGVLDPEQATQSILGWAKAEMAVMEALSKEYKTRFWYPEGNHPWAKEGPRVTPHESFRHEYPPVTVTVPPFLLGAYELSQAEWKRASGEASFTGEYPEPDRPRVFVSYESILDWLSRAGDGLRLPSQAEWEWGCRAGTESTFFWGEGDDARGVYSVCFYHMWAYILYRDQSGKLALGRQGPLSRSKHPRQPNAFGLVDTLGNIWEYVADAESPRLPLGKTLPDHLPRGDPKAKRRARLGGGLNYGGAACSRPSARGGSDRAKELTWAQGFRVARSLPE